MIVIDVNILVYVLTNSPQRPRAVTLLSNEIDWRVPTLWRHEFLNVVTTLVRADRLSLDEGRLMWARGRFCR
jgi:predicted nucleic acid-binding protein